MTPQLSPRVIEGAFVSVRLTERRRRRRPRLVSRPSRLAARRPSGTTHRPSPSLSFVHDQPRDPPRRSPHESACASAGHGWCRPSDRRPHCSRRNRVVHARDSLRGWIGNTDADALLIDRPAADGKMPHRERRPDIRCFGRPLISDGSPRMGPPSFSTTVTDATPDEAASSSPRPVVGAVSPSCPAAMRVTTHRDDCCRT